MEDMASSAELWPVASPAELWAIASSAELWAIGSCTELCVAWKRNCSSELWKMPQDFGAAESVAACEKLNLCAGMAACVCAC